MLNLLFSLVTNSASSFCGTLEYILLSKKPTKGINLSLQMLQKSNDVDVILLLFTLLCCFSVAWPLTWLHDEELVNRFPFPVTEEIMQLQKNEREKKTWHVSDFLTVVSILGGVKAAVIVLKLRKNHTN